MTATLPLVKHRRQLEGERFAPDPGSPIVLSMAAPDRRLSDAARSLFPGRELREQRLAGDSPYALLWGPPDRFELPSDIPAADRLPPEGYRLALFRSTAQVSAGDAAGLFYGLQTLRQLLDQGTPLEAAVLVDWPDVALRCMNYDLRQTFSKPELLIEYLDTLASFKTNALLIEYEDKFPFERHREFRHPEHALSERELERLLAAADRNFIEVIPLQQSFGHLEYILGRESYRGLRETETSTGELCPSRPESFALVTGLIGEMASRHPGSRYFHLGCDEVYSLCECPACREAYGGSRIAAFLDFANRLVDFVCGLGKKPIIWQDVLDGCSDEELGRLDRRVTVMIWHYNGKNIDRLVSTLAERLQSLGIEVMGAPSVRCFDRKDDQNYPLVCQRISNIEQWAEIAAKRRLAGLVGTNWTAVFSLGVPYGVFETTWYTMAYFADACWHGERPAGDRFIDRFLRVFHGIAPETAERLLGRYDDEDYYAAMPKLADAAVRNKGVAELIAAMIDFETAADRSRTIHKYVYRHRLHPDSEAERRSLSDNYRITRAGLRRARARMEAALLAFQPADMAGHYVLSRFYLHDYLQDHLYKAIGLVEEEAAEA